MGCSIDHRCLLFNGDVMFAVCYCCMDNFLRLYECLNVYEVLYEHFPMRMKMCLNVYENKSVVLAPVAWSWRQDLHIAWDSRVLALP